MSLRTWGGGVVLDCHHIQGLGTHLSKGPVVGSSRQMSAPGYLLSPGHLLRAAPCPSPCGLPARAGPWSRASRVCSLALPFLGCCANLGKSFSP